MKTSPLFGILAALVLTTGVAVPTAANDLEKNPSKLNRPSSAGATQDKENDGAAQTLGSDHMQNAVAGSPTPDPALDINPAKQFQIQYDADDYRENKEFPFNLISKSNNKITIILILALLILFIFSAFIIRMKYTSKSKKKGLQQPDKTSYLATPTSANQAQADAEGRYKRLENTIKNLEELTKAHTSEIEALKGKIAALKIPSSSVSSQGNYGEPSILPLSGGPKYQPYHEVQSESPSIDEGVLREKCADAIRAVRKCSDPDEYEADLRAIGELRNAYDASGEIRISGSYSEDPSAQIVAVMLNDRSVIILPSCDYIRNFSGNANVHVAPMEIRLSYQLEPTGECSLGIEQVTIGVVTEDNIVDDINKGLLLGFTGDTSL